MEPSFIAQFSPNASLSMPMALWFIFHEGQLLLKKTAAGYVIPTFSNQNSLTLLAAQKHYLGLYDNIPCFTGRINHLTDISLPSEITFHPIRSAYQLLGHNETLGYLISRAKQILHWDTATQFCGQCGQKTQISDTERAKKCIRCNILFFPQIAPVMCVLIFRADKILLARSPHFSPGIYSILAGFVEPGETLEQAVLREVKEEVNIGIKNLCYFGSQPWPFVSNLMLGFMAEYDYGVIEMDPKEIEDAKWFDKNALPPLPETYSLSRRMIEHWRNNIP